MAKLNKYNSYISPEEEFVNDMRSESLLPIFVDGLDGYIDYSIVCSSISGEQNYVNGMPKSLRLNKIDRYGNNDSIEYMQVGLNLMDKLDMLHANENVEALKEIAMYFKENFKPENPTKAQQEILNKLKQL